MRLKLEVLILIGFATILLVLYLPSSAGVTFFVFVTIIFILVLIFLKYLKWFFPFFKRRESLLNHSLMITASVMLATILVECFLWAYQVKYETFQRVLIPLEWKKRGARIPGASSAYYWHNILHVHDKNGMRRNSPFPAKTKNRFRIIVVGDSLTYGYGVREENTYARRIEDTLKEKYRVEVLNLGVSGYQSEDILKLIKEYTPALDPDLIFYGVCLNDFLPSGVGQYRNNMAYRFPIPEPVKKCLVEKTRLGRLISDAYDSLLMKIGLRNDFFADILKDFKHYQTRFAKDVRDMNAFVLQRGLVPVIAMVLNQSPNLSSKGYQIALVAEHHLTHAGMTVIPTQEFYRNYDKENMVVSPWEGHPNARAHQIFSDMIVAHLVQMRKLEKYRIIK